MERAIYLVGGLAIFLLGFRAAVLSALTLYDAIVPGPAPGPGSHFWVDQSVAIALGFLFILAGLFLLFLAWRVHRKLSSPPIGSVSPVDTGDR